MQVKVQQIGMLDFIVPANDESKDLFHHIAGTSVLYTQENIKQLKKMCKYHNEDFDFKEV